MDIVKFKDLLTELMSVGISEVVFDPLDDGTRIRGANKNGDVIVFYDLKDVEFSKMQIGVQSVRGLLSRIELFDENKAKVTLEPSSDEDIVANVIVKQGRKKASYKCGDPDTLVVPKFVPGELTVNKPIKLSKSYVEYLSNAITSISHTGQKNEQTIGVSVEDGDITFTIFDGEEDSFVDVLEGAGEGDIGKNYWEVSPFQKVMTRSMMSSEDETALFGVIEDNGVGVFTLSMVDVIVTPVLVN